MYDFQPISFIIGMIVGANIGIIIMAVMANRNGGGGGGITA